MPQFLQTQQLLGITRAFATDVPDAALKKIILAKIGALACVNC